MFCSGMPVMRALWVTVMPSERAARIAAADLDAYIESMYSEASERQ